MDTDVEPLPSEVRVPSGTFHLRRYVAADVEPLGRAVAASVDHLRPFMPWAADEPLPPERRLELFAAWDAEHAAGRSAIFGMFADGAVLGGCGLHRRREGRPDIVEIGYWVHVDHTRQGVASAAASALTDAAFAIATTNVVEILHEPGNLASRGVPAKLGFTDHGESIVRGLLFRVWRVDRAAWGLSG